MDKLVAMVNHVMTQQVELFIHHWLPILSSFPVMNTFSIEILAKVF
jgi:hypothetical protein